MSISCSGSLATGFVSPNYSGIQTEWSCYDATLSRFPPCTKLEEQNIENNAAALESVCMEVIDTHSSAHIFVARPSFSLVVGKCDLPCTWNSKNTQYWWLWVLSTAIGRTGEAERWNDDHSDRWALRGWCAEFGAACKGEKYLAHGGLGVYLSQNKYTSSR